MEVVIEVYKDYNWITRYLCRERTQRESADMNTSRFIIDIIILVAIVYISESPASAQDNELECHDAQRDFINRLGPSATFLSWFPKCLPGGYYFNVQCSLTNCFCAFLDTGTRIPNTPEDKSEAQIRDKCPWRSKTHPDICSMPPQDYPCQKKLSSFYFNPNTRKCEENNDSCLGFASLDECKVNCVDIPILCKFTPTQPTHSTSNTNGLKIIQCECKDGYEREEDTGKCVKKTGRCKSGFVDSPNGCVPLHRWSPWNSWEPCNSTCGGGMRTRRRNCENAGLPDLTCTGTSEEREECNTQKCPESGRADIFGECSATCGGGVRPRFRMDRTTFNVAFVGSEACATQRCAEEGVCSSEPCQNGGSCVNELKKQYACICPDGTKGKNCEEIEPRIDETINSKGAIKLHCVSPAEAGKITWRLDRIILDESIPWLQLKKSDTVLRIKEPHFTFSGNYLCQFKYKKTLYKAQKKLVIKVDSQEACGGTPGTGVSARTRGPRILGGRITKDLMAPYVAMLYNNALSRISCAGSLVDTRHVITAAHCFDVYSADEITVYVGKLESNVSLVERHQQSSNISNILRHPEYNPDTFHADIAILELENKMYFSAGVKPLCVPNQYDNSEDVKIQSWSGGERKYGIIYGWGTTEKSEHSRRLRELALPILENNECDRGFLKGNITNLMFCAGGQRNKDACQGDSGGPFTLWSRQHSRWYLGGITSWAPRGCGLEGEPGVYAKLTMSMRKWIYDNTDL